jgi:hypothetical protein
MVEWLSENAKIEAEKRGVGQNMPAVLVMTGGPNDYASR